MDASAETVHATCVAIGQDGVLIRGASGIGKSDLALRLLQLNTIPAVGDVRLVCDDRVALTLDEKTVVARAAPNLLGKLEVRGIGIVPVEAVPSAPVRLVVDAVPREDVLRMPEAEDLVTKLCGVSVARVALDVLEPSSPAKVLVALQLARTRSLHANRMAL